MTVDRQEPDMPRTTRLLVIAVVAAVAVPALPLLLFGVRLDRAVEEWLATAPPAPALAATLVAVLAADILLPVPSSVVATLAGAVLGVPLATACGWAGMTLGSVAGWALGRLVGTRALARLPDDERAALVDRQSRLGPGLVLLTRPLPLLAEATALLGGATGMRLAEFLPAAAAGNLAVALAWSVAGALGRRWGGVETAAIAALLLPAAATWWAWHRRAPVRST
jgi:uncharacterized membrane protein YdjX (TVP38/TMEM64 family)